ncbi:MAG TPA: hypothetical protein VEN81_10760 [Planctomycetota bacterium]|nr:hypothetical protein [Planctomycetota bacterium]
MTRAIAALVVILGASRAWAQDEHVGVQVREWYAKMDGDIKSSGGILGGTSISLANDLGLDKTEWNTEVLAYARLPVLGKIYAGYWSIDRKSDEILTRTITFDKQAFTASTEVDTDVRLEVGYLTYEFDFPTIPLGELLKIELGVQVGARVIHAEGKIDSIIASGSDQGTIGLPVVGGHAAVQVTPYLRADVEVVGLQVSYGGHRGTYVEGYGEVVGQPVKWIFAGVGYKYVSLGVRSNLSSTDFALDTRISGFYLTAGLRF